MKQLNWNTNQLQKALLVLIPLLYFIAGGYFRNLLGNLSLRSCDPEYIYFMSGLTLSDGNLKLGHIDNPGTPLQVMMALVFKLTYFFRSAPVPYVEDVLLHPDLYLSVASLFIVAATTLLLLFAGNKVYKSTNSIFYALLIQTAPFLPVIWYDLVGRVAPELIMPFPVVLLIVLIISVYFKNGKTTTKELLFFSLISALGLSIKLTFLPLWFIPFLIIDGWKKRFSFIGLSFLFFFIMAFPMTLRIEVFLGWVKNLFLHSGQYGGGESNIIDFASLGTNLKELYGYEKRYFYVFFSLMAVLAGYLGYFRKKAERRISIIAIAVIITIALQVVMVGKHYAHRYFIPVLMLQPLLVFLLAEIIKKFYPKKVTTYLISIGIIFFFVWQIQFNKQWLPIKTEAMGNDIANRMPTWHVAQTLEKDSYKIIASQNYGCPFIEYTLMYSTVWASHKKQEEYKPILARLYPDTYNFFTWDNSMRYWGEKFNAQKVTESGKNVYLYLERNEEELYNRTISKLQEENGGEFMTEKDTVFLNDKTGEIILKLIIQPEQVDSLIL
jgi:hypothetical protein